MLIFCSNSIYVGDSPTDGMAAKNAGFGLLVSGFLGERIVTTPACFDVVVNRKVLVYN